MQRIDQTLVTEKINFPPPPIQTGAHLRSRPKSALRLHLEAMNVGDAFAVNAGHKAANGLVQAIRKKLDRERKYAIRKLADGRTGIWRIS